VIAVNAEKLRTALRATARVLNIGEATHDRDDWMRRSPLFHVEHAERHLQRFRWGQDDGEDHLANAAARILMALEVQKQTSRHEEVR
jgi:Domain of unknown function (DUF5664)